MVLAVTRDAICQCGRVYSGYVNLSRQVSRDQSKLGAQCTQPCGFGEHDKPV